MAYIAKTTLYLKRNIKPIILGAAIAIILVLIYKKIVGCPCKKKDSAEIKLPGAEIDVKLPKNSTDA